MLERINSYIWGNGLIFLILITGILYTVRLGFIQIKIFPYFFKKFRRNKNKREQFGTFCMSLGTAMGTGNITGVASAIRIGGAGAVFWMWISAILGMSVVYTENFLSARYSTDEIRGPMAYIRFGLNCRPLSYFFAICCVFASFGMGGAAQISTLSDNLYQCTHINHVLLAGLIFILIFVIIQGGAERISCAAKVLLPAASVIYTVICIASVMLNRHALPAVISDIFEQASGVKQVFGGFTGYTVSKTVSVGLRRGIFSNEAGLGSSPILHSSSKNYSSYKVQGMCSMLEVFIDTMLCCTLTAAAVLCSSGDPTVYSALRPVTGANTNFIIALLMAVFAFCTVIGWSYCGSAAFSYIFKCRRSVFPAIYAVISASGAVIRSETVWTVSDIFNGLMAFPTIIALLLLIGQVKKE